MCPKRLVGLRGLEPPPLAGHDPKSCASASSATSPALFRRYDSTKTPAAMPPRRAPMTTVEQHAEWVELQARRVQAAINDQMELLPLNLIRPVH